MIVASKVSSRKNKGRKLQQWVAQKVSELTGFEYGKDKPIESRPMGQSGPDLRLDSNVLYKFPFSIECKNQENWKMHQWIDQAQKNRLPNTDWLLVCKRNQKNPVVIMDAEVFFNAKILKW